MSARKSHRGRFCTLAGERGSRSTTKSNQTHQSAHIERESETKGKRRGRREGESHPKNRSVVLRSWSGTGNAISGEALHAVHRGVQTQPYVGPVLIGSSDSICSLIARASLSARVSLSRRRPSSYTLARDRTRAADNAIDLISRVRKVSTSGSQLPEQRVNGFAAG